jgi:tRNA A37 threonylcarbamoyladenosine dehydratase
MNESDWQCRTELLVGAEKMQRLKQSHVFIAGLGGVGGYAAEQLCRAGIGKLTLADCDRVQTSNLNRQIIALQSTVGQFKTQVLAERLKDINPEIELELIDDFLDEKIIPEILESPFRYLVDAIDTLTPKVTLLKEAFRRQKFIVSSMGSGGKTDLSKVQVADISASHHCKFAYMVRKYLHRQGIREGIQVVYSPEPVRRNTIIETDGSGNKRSVVGTISYMPAVFGCFCAAEVIKEVIKGDPPPRLSILL